MNCRIYKVLSLLLAVFIATFTLAACEGNRGGYNQEAYAPPFAYEYGQDLRSRMPKLAYELQLLDNALIADYDEGPVPQQSIVDSLRNIERIAQSLQPSDLNSRHPFLLENLDRLISDARKAREEAERFRYYMAGRISGACASCHRTVYLNNNSL